MKMKAEALPALAALLWLASLVGNRLLKLLWLGVGTEGFLYPPAMAFDEYPKEKQIGHQSLVTAGGHAWMNARHYLAETLPLYLQ
jgi:hypothetical protein